MEFGPDGRHIIPPRKKMLALAVVIDCRFLLYLSGMALLEEELVGQKLTESIPHMTPSIKSAIKIIQLRDKSRWDLRQTQFTNSPYMIVLTPV